MSETMIEARDLRKAYGPTRVLAGVDLDIARGEVFALLGRNGAGKTTAVNILSTLIRPDAGAARVAGADVATEPRKVRSRIALTGQFATVDEFQTGEENLFMMGRLAHLPARDVRVRAAELLERFELASAARRRVSTYSGGMRRRLDLVLSLVAHPLVLILDEPTTGLDLPSRTQLWDVVRDLAADGTTVLLTTQYLEEADRLADRMAVLHGGAVAALGTAAELKSLIAGDRVRVRLADRESFRAVRDLRPDAVDVDESGFALTLAAPDAVDELRAVLELADRHGLAVAGLAVAQPTLDDVFLALTAKEAAA